MNKELIEKIKELAENYAHCYSFVGDDSMPIAQEKLYSAIDEIQEIQEIINKELMEKVNEIVSDNMWFDGDKEEMGLSEDGISEIINLIQSQMTNNDNNNRTALPATDLEPDTGDEPVAKEKTTGFNSLVNISITSYRKRKHDPDGISVKAVLDGLIRRGILKDDSASEINKVTFKSIIIKKDEEEKTLIEISDE